MKFIIAFLSVFLVSLFTYNGVTENTFASEKSYQTVVEEKEQTLSTADLEDIDEKFIAIQGQLYSYSSSEHFSEEKAFLSKTTPPLLDPPRHSLA